MLKRNLKEPRISQTFLKHPNRKEKRSDLQNGSMITSISDRKERGVRFDDNRFAKREERKAEEIVETLLPINGDEPLYEELRPLTDNLAGSRYCY